MPVSDRDERPVGGGRGGHSGGHSYADLPRDERPIGGAPSMGRDERPVGGGSRDERPAGGAMRDERPVGGRSERPAGPAAGYEDDGPDPFGGRNGGAPAARGNPERPLPRPAGGVASYEAQAAQAEDADAMGGLVECEKCGRRFASHRIDAHSRACKGGEQKARKVFNAAKQRIGGVEGVTQADIKAAQETAVRNARAIQQQRRNDTVEAQARAPAREGPGYREGPSREGGPRPQPMLGKDGRPLSPLSAAIARKKAGMDPYEEDPNDMPTDIRPCPCCGRNFAADRLEVHLQICTKVASNSQQRGTWNSQVSK